MPRGISTLRRVGPSFAAMHRIFDPRANSKKSSCRSTPSNASGGIAVLKCEAFSSRSANSVAQANRSCHPFGMLPKHGPRHTGPQSLLQIGRGSSFVAIASRTTRQSLRSLLFRFLRIVLVAANSLSDRTALGQKRMCTLIETFAFPRSQNTNASEVG